MRWISFIFICIAISLHTATWRVDTTGQEGDSLQLAIDSAWANRFDGIDTVLVENGTYHVNTPYGLIMRDSVILLSIGNAENCTLTGISESGLDTCNHVIYCDFGNYQSTAAIIKGFTITGGHARESTTSHDRGGGINCRYASPVIESCIIVNNKASSISSGYGEGGGIALGPYSFAIVKNCHIISNTAVAGAGMVIWDYSDAIVTENTIANNWATGTGIIGNQGGAIYIWNASPTISDNIIYNNIANLDGGGIWTGGGGSATIEHNMIMNNTTFGKGGGLCLGRPITCYFNIIIGNYASQGGGIFSNISVGVTKCVFLCNISDSGGVIYNNSGTIAMDSCFIVDNGDISLGKSGVVYINDIADFSYSNIYYNTYQTDTEIYNNTGVTCTLENNFWWDTTDTDISTIIYGPNDHTPWFNGFIPGVPGEPISIDSVRNYDRDFNLLVNYYGTIPETLHIRVYGQDRLASIREACVVILRSSIYPNGIAVALLETDTNSGIYEGEAYLLEATGSDTQRIDDIYQRLRVDTAWDIVDIIANVDTTEKYTVYYKIPPDIELSDTIHDYGNVILGYSSTWNYLWIKDTSGEANLTVDSVKLHKSEYEIISPSFPQVVFAQDSIAVSIRFTPQDSGSVFDTLLIFSDDPDEPIRKVYLRGRGVGPIIELSCSSHDFGNVWVGDSADWQYLWIKNVGNNDLTVDSLILAKTIFKVVSPSFPQTVLVGDSLAVTLRFLVTDTGILDDTLKIYSNDLQHPVVRTYLYGYGEDIVIALSDTLHDFGRVGVGNSVYWNWLIIKNNGNVELVVDSAILTDTAFKIITPVLPETISGGDTILMQIEFNPYLGGTLQETLRIYSNARNESVSRVLLLGEGVTTPVIALKDSLHDFGDVGLGFSLTWQYLWIKNLGGDTLVIDSFVCTNDVFSTVSPTVPESVPPDDSIGASVRFTPDDTGKVYGVMKIYSNDPVDSIVSVELVGRGVGPVIDIEDTSHDFGEVWLGDSSIWDFSIKNSGNMDLTVDSVVTSDSVFKIDFSQTILTTGESVLTTVRFIPVDTFAEAGTLKVYSDDPRNPVVCIFLYGQGVLGPDIALKDTLHDFGNTWLYYSITWQLWLKNEGNVALKIDSVKNSNGVFEPDTNLPDSILPEDSACIEITFTPKDTGRVSTYLYIYSNDPDEHVSTVYLTGRGIGPDIVVKDTLHNFGEVLYNDTVTWQFYILNIGNAELTVNDVVPTNETYCVVEPEFPLNIPVRDSNYVKVQFIAPIDTGTYSGELKIYSNDPDEPTCILHLAARAVAPDIVLQDTLYELDSVIVNDTVSFGFYIKNGGSVNLSIDSIVVLTPEMSILTPSLPVNITPKDSIEVKLSLVVDDTGIYESGLKIYSDDPDEPVTSVRIKAMVYSIEEILPKRFAISQNAPNPFTQSTIIKYQLPKETWVTIKVYDLSGRCVATLVDEVHTPGYYKVKWLAKDANGNLLPCGIYFYTAKLGKYKFTRKAIILR